MKVVFWIRFKVDPRQTWKLLRNTKIRKTIVKLEFKVTLLMMVTPKIFWIITMKWRFIPNLSPTEQVKTSFRPIKRRTKSINLTKIWKSLRFLSRLTILFTVAKIKVQTNRTTEKSSVLNKESEKLEALSWTRSESEWWIKKLILTNAKLPKKSRWKEQKRSEIICQISRLKKVSSTRTSASSATRTMRNTWDFHPWKKKLEFIKSQLEMGPTVLTPAV